MCLRKGVTPTFGDFSAKLSGNCEYKDSRDIPIRSYRSYLRASSMSSTQSVNLPILKRAAERLAKRIGRTGLSSGADKRPLISINKPLEPFSVVMFTRCTVSKHHYSFPSGRTSYLALFPEEQIIELCFFQHLVSTFFATSSSFPLSAKNIRSLSIPDISGFL